MINFMKTIRILEAKIIEGKYKWCPHFEKYLLMNDNCKLVKNMKMLKVLFESNDSDINWFVITSLDYGFTPCHQYIINKDEKEFFFPIEGYIPLDQIRINGFKRLSNNTTTYVIKKLIASSDLIKDHLNK